MKRLGALALAVFALLAAASTALGVDPHDEQERLTPADMALARQAAVEVGDLGSGWRRIPSSGSSEDSSCPGFDPDFSAFIRTGKAEATFEHVKLAGAQIDSGVEVYRTKAQALGDFRLGARPGLLACLRKSLEREFGSSTGFAARIVSSRMTVVPHVADRAVAYRVVSTIAGKGKVFELYMDLLAFVRGRSQGFLGFVSLDEPVAGQLALGRRVAARMR